MNKIRWFLLFSIISIMTLLCSCSYIENLTDKSDVDRKKVDGVWVYSVDFTEKYKETLNAMFSNNWSIENKEEKYEEPEEVCDHVDSTPLKYLEWNIQYFDDAGDERVFILNNKQTLSYQIEDYLEEFIPQYYKNTYYDTFLKDIPLAGASYVFGFLDRVSVNPQLEENKIRVEKTEKYIKNSETPLGAICLSKITPATIFDVCPFYLTVSVSIDNGGYSSVKKKELEEHVKQKIIEMISSMNDFTGHNLNANVSVCSN